MPTSSPEATEPGAGFRRIGERKARGSASFFELVTGTFLDPAGFTFEREIVRHCGAVCIAPLEHDGLHVLCVRQYRAAVDRWLLELPAGKLDVALEDPRSCAARELAEEVGRSAESLTELCSFYNSPGFSDETTTVFLAEGLATVPRSADGIEERYLTLERLALVDLDELIRTGELCDAKTIIALAVLRQHLGARDRATAEPAPVGEDDEVGDDQRG